MSHGNPGLVGRVGGGRTDVRNATGPRRGTVFGNKGRRRDRLGRGIWASFPKAAGESFPRETRARIPEPALSRNPGGSSRTRKRPQNHRIKPRIVHPENAPLRSSRGNRTLDRHIKARSQDLRANLNAPAGSKGGRSDPAGWESCTQSDRGRTRRLQEADPAAGIRQTTRVPPPGADETTSVPPAGGPMPHQPEAQAVAFQRDLRQADAVVADLQRHVGRRAVQVDGDARRSRVPQAVGHGLLGDPEQVGGAAVPASRGGPVTRRSTATPACFTRSARNCKARSSPAGDTPSGVSPRARQRTSAWTSRSPRAIFATRSRTAGSRPATRTVRLSASSSNPVRCWPTWSCSSSPIRWLSARPRRRPPAGGSSRRPAPPGLWNPNPASRPILCWTSLPAARRAARRPGPFNQRLNSTCLQHHTRFRAGRIFHPGL